jgi:hypothetical protein
VRIVHKAAGLAEAGHSKAVEVAYSLVDNLGEAFADKPLAALGDFDTPFEEGPVDTLPWEHPLALLLVLLLVDPFADPMEPLPFNRMGKMNE